MSDLLAFITWDVDPNLITSPLAVRYYGVLWAVSFFIGLFLMRKMMNNDNAPDAYTDKIFIYVLIGAVLGARLGHVIFYDPGYYFSAAHWKEIPMIWQGGLASHGGAIGVILANWLYAKRVSKKSFLWSADKIVVTVALAACLIRVGNLMNSEIIGRESSSEFAVFFKNAAEQEIKTEILKMTGEEVIPVSVEIDSEHSQNNICAVKINVSSNQGLSEEKLHIILKNLKTNHLEGGPYFNSAEDHIKTAETNMDLAQLNAGQGYIQFGVQIIPRIPTQIWEAMSYLVIFFLLFWGYWARHWYKREGLLFGLFMILLFGARIIIEFFKENQAEGVAEDAGFNRGQQLSVPLVLLGLYFVIRALRAPEKDTKVIDNK